MLKTIIEKLKRKMKMTWTLMWLNWNVATINENIDIYIYRIYIYRIYIYLYIFLYVSTFRYIQNIDIDENCSSWKMFQV